MDNDANLWNRSASDAGSWFPDEHTYQMKLSKYVMLSRFLFPSVVCVSEIKQKGITKWHHDGIYPSMVGVWVGPFFADKDSPITPRNLWISA